MAMAARFLVRQLDAQGEFENAAQWRRLFVTSVAKEMASAPLQVTPSSRKLPPARVSPLLTCRDASGCPRKRDVPAAGKAPLTPRGGTRSALPAATVARHCVVDPPDGGLSGARERNEEGERGKCVGMVVLACVFSSVSKSVHMSSACVYWCGCLGVLSFQAPLALRCAAHEGLVALISRCVMASNHTTNKLVRPCVRPSQGPRRTSSCWAPTSSHTRPVPAARGRWRRAGGLQADAVVGRSAEGRCAGAGL